MPRLFTILALVGALTMMLAIPASAAPGDPLYGCTFAGATYQVNTVAPPADCGQGTAFVIEQGTDYYACVFGSIYQFGTTVPANCGQGSVVGLAAGTDYHACAYKGSFSQFGTTPPANCGRGVPVGFAAY